MARRGMIWLDPPPRAPRYQAAVPWRWRPHTARHEGRLRKARRPCWFIEIIIDTGQRYQSDDLYGFTPAADLAEDQRRLGRVVAVTMIHAATGEALQRPSANLVASLATRRHGHLDRVSDDAEAELLREALGTH